MIKTLKELKEIDELVNNILTRDPKLKKDKFRYAYNKFYSKNVKPLLEELQEQLVDIRIENAMTDDKTKEILYTDASNRMYKFTKEGIKKMTEEVRKITKEFEEKKVEIIPFFTKDIEGLLDEEIEELKGLIIE